MANKHFVNDKQLFEVVRNYISDPNSNRPLLVIGHTGIGKTAIIKRAIDTCGAEVDFQTLNFGPAKEQHNKCLELVRAYDANENKHLIIELTCEYEGNFRTTLNQLAGVVLWVYYREDVNDFLEWARETDEQGHQNMDELMCGYLEQNPDSFSSAVNNEKKIIQSVWDRLDVATEHLQNDDVTAAIKELQIAVQHLFVVTLDDELLHHFVNQVNSLLWEFKEKDPNQILFFVGALQSVPYLNMSEEDTETE